MKSKLIHLLGGHTEEENALSYLLGCEFMAKSTLAFAKMCYGLDSETWSKKIYNRLCENVQETENQLRKINKE